MAIAHLIWKPTISPQIHTPHIEFQNCSESLDLVCTIVPNMVHLVLLSTHCVDSSPCVVLVTENNRILFDVGEGTQRLCVEHGIKLAKMNDVFLTRFSTECVGGLPGMYHFV